MFVQTLLATHRWWENSSPSFFHPIKLLFLVAPRRTAATALCPEGTPSSTASRPRSGSLAIPG